MGCMVSTTTHDEEEGHGQGKGNGPALPYDAVPWPGSTSSSSTSTSNGGDLQARAFLEAFLEYAQEKEQDLPAPLKNLLQPNVEDNLRLQQKRLNKHRGLLQKIENKKRAIQRDQDEWLKWIAEMKDTIQQQKQRHKEQEEKLTKELKEPEQEEEELRKQKECEEIQTLSVPAEEEDEVELMMDELMDEENKSKEKMEETKLQKQKELEVRRSLPTNGRPIPSAGHESLQQQPEDRPKNVAVGHFRELQKKGNSNRPTQER